MYKLREFVHTTQTIKTTKARPEITTIVHTVLWNGMDASWPYSRRTLIRKQISYELCFTYNVGVLFLTHYTF